MLSHKIPVNGCYLIYDPVVTLRLGSYLSSTTYPLSTTASCYLKPKEIKGHYFISKASAAEQTSRAPAQLQEMSLNGAINFTLNIAILTFSL